MSSGASAVIAGERDLGGTSFSHRQPPDEVGHPGKGQRLEFGVLAQVVFPRLELDGGPTRPRAPRRGRMEGLSPVAQEPGDRVLGQPVDLFLSVPPRWPTSAKPTPPMPPVTSFAAPRPCALCGGERRRLRAGPDPSGDPGSPFWPARECAGGRHRVPHRRPRRESQQVGNSLAATSRRSRPLAEASLEC